MVRGRKVNPDAPPSRQLEISRAFRQRRAQTLESLREQLAHVQAENDQLRAENDSIRRSLPSPKIENGNDQAFEAAHGGNESCMNCVNMRLEMDRMYLQLKQKEDQLAHMSAAAATSTSTTPTLCSAGASSTSPSTSSSFKCTSSERESGTHTARDDETIGTEHNAKTSKGCCGSKTSNACTTVAAQTTVRPSARTELANAAKWSLPSGPLPFEHEAWEESVRANGGDPAKCCAGFFECDENGKIIIPLPPSMQSQQQQQHHHYHHPT